MLDPIWKRSRLQKSAENKPASHQFRNSFCLQLGVVAQLMVLEKRRNVACHLLFWMSSDFRQQNDRRSDGTENRHQALKAASGFVFRDTVVAVLNQHKKKLRKPNCYQGAAGEEASASVGPAGHVLWSHPRS